MHPHSPLHLKGYHASAASGCTGAAYSTHLRRYGLDWHGLDWHGLDWRGAHWKYSTFRVGKDSGLAAPERQVKHSPVRGRPADLQALSALASLCLLA
jgi:hypothetical protein